LVVGKAFRLLGKTIGAYMATINIDRIYRDRNHLRSRWRKRRRQRRWGRWSGQRIHRGWRRWRASNRNTVNLGQQQSILVG